MTEVRERFAHRSPLEVSSPPSLFQRVAEFLPEGTALPVRDWEIRHRFVLFLVFGHAVALAGFGLIQGWGPAYSLGEGAVIGLLGLVGAWERLGRRFRSAATVLALVISSAVFTQFWGGYIEGHFHFFIVVAIATLYQDYVPFLLSIAFVAIDHGVVGTLAPEWVYNHPDAIANPWKWAGYHAALVLGECVVLLYVWRATERTRSQVDLLMNAAGEGILGLDERGRVAFANPAAAAMTGRSLTELLDQPLEAIVRRPDEPGAALDLARAESYRVGEDLVVVRSQGPPLPVTWASSPVREHGRTVGSVLTLVDATPRRVAEEERRKRAEQLSELERLKELNSFKTLFINTAAHELHTPLTPLRLNVFALKEGHKGKLNPGQKEVVGVLERNVERLSLLVEDVLNAARLQAHRFTIATKEVDVEKLVHETFGSFEAQAREATVSLAYRARGPTWTVGDERRLGQVLHNLVDNALKFSKPGGTITVDVQHQDAGLVVSVSDEGAGIAPKDFARLFQPFSQVHDHMEYTRSGSGLGLYICKGIVELHGGRIWGESAGLGRGSTFSFSLPSLDKAVLRPNGESKGH